MTKKQIRELIKLIKDSKNEIARKNKAYEKYAKLEFEEQYIPWLSDTTTPKMLEVIKVIADKSFYKDLEYLIYDLDNEWPDDTIVLEKSDGTEITKANYKSWLIEEYGK